MGVDESRAANFCSRIVTTGFARECPRRGKAVSHPRNSAPVVEIPTRPASSPVVSGQAAPRGRPALHWSGDWSAAAFARRSPRPRSARALRLRSRQSFRRALGKAHPPAVHIKGPASPPAHAGLSSAPECNENSPRALGVQDAPSAASGILLRPQQPPRQVCSLAASSARFPGPPRYQRVTPAWNAFERRDNNLRLAWPLPASVIDSRRLRRMRGALLA